jgi:hypothetical protein
MKRTEKTAIYIQGTRVGWALSNGEFEPAPGWMVVNDHIVPAFSIRATQNGDGKGREKRLGSAPTHGKPEGQPGNPVGS